MVSFRTVAVGLAAWTAMAVCGWAQSDVKKISQSEAVAAAVSKVQPEYPPMAKQLKLQGVAEIELTIGEDGTVEKVEVVSGNPMLTKPCADAVKKWKFKPFTEDGKPAKRQAPLTFTFKL